MPRFDGTGSDGLGPMTGGGMGACQQASNCGRGRGCGRRSFCRFSNSVEIITSQEKIESLKASKERLEAEIKKLEKEQK
ncbi:DUF5320 domain-containing protein [Candidatus Babeliales bacterium]|nr:DUF5320 domain-containing protein [Candidatus Babeliales bacterium]